MEYVCLGVASEAECQPEGYKLVGHSRSEGEREREVCSRDKYLRVNRTNRMDGCGNKDRDNVERQ